jgi:parvulin-like peptidyl-prolyl isomerase
MLVMRGGETDTNNSPMSGINPNQVVATVNGDDVVGSDLRTSINQIAATAQLQGIDITDPNVQTEIQQQAVEVLINTALLEQEAAERGIEVSDEEVEARIEALVQEVGSQELLNERMEALGIDDDMLVEDVRSELVIQNLLDQVFSEADIVVTEEEISAFYESSGSADELDAIRPQLEAQLQVSKEQQVLDEFISELRTDAEVELF